jgi:hypothetical protein
MGTTCELTTNDWDYSECCEAARGRKAPLWGVAYYSALWHAPNYRSLPAFATAGEGRCLVGAFAPHAR